jgi:hypothetical protein
MPYFKSHSIDEFNLKASGKFPDTGQDNSFSLIQPFIMPANVAGRLYSELKLGGRI